MICRACDQPMTADAGVHTCPHCGRRVSLLDPGYVPSAGFQPVPYRTETFALLEEEKGWAQDDAPSLEERAPKRPHPARLPVDHPVRLAWRDRMIEAQAARRVRERATDPSVISNARKKAWATRTERAQRLAAALTREAKHAQRQATRAIDAATRKRAKNGARTGKWYAEQRGAA